MCCHIECAEFKVRAGLSGTKCNQGKRPRQKADEADDAPLFFVLSLLFSPRWQKLKGWEFFFSSVSLLFISFHWLCVAAAPCLKDEREDLLSHDTWRGGRNHSRDEDETVGADMPVPNILYAQARTLSYGASKWQIFCASFSVLRYFPVPLPCISCRCGWIWSGKLFVHRHQRHKHLSFLLLTSPFSLFSHN